MYYKLLDKNLLTAALVSVMALTSAQTCDAQGVVSLVEDEKVSASENNENGNAALNDDMALDTDLPDVLPEDDFIPLDNGLLSPAPASAPAVKSEAAPAPAALTPQQPKQTEEFNEDMDFSLELEAPATVKKPTAPISDAPAANPLFPAANRSVQEPTGEKFANSVLAKVDNDLFNQMSDIEKQTTLLTLELRREKLRNEIEAIKAQRLKATEEKIAAEEEKKRKEFEWKKEQEAKVLREQQALKQKEIELEKLKQKKVLNSYMNKMLEQNQKWIQENSQIYKQMREIETDRQNLAADFKAKLDSMTTMSNKVAQSADNAKSNHDRTLASLTAQNIQLKKRIEAEAIAAKNREQNPFAANNANNKGMPVATSIDSKIVPINIAKEYAIMDITGKGENLVAKLINKEGDSFMARKGTVLQTGHSVEEITPTYIQFDRNGLKDYLYTTGSAMAMEPDKMESSEQTPQKNNKKPIVAPVKKSGISSDRGVPSLGTGMFVK